VKLRVDCYCVTSFVCATRSKTHQTFHSIPDYNFTVKNHGLDNQIVSKIFTMAFSRFNKKPSSTVSTSSTTPFPLLILNLVLRFLQLAFAIAVIGLYATDLSNARKQHKYQDSKWIYAVVVATLSAFTSLVYVVPMVKWAWGFGWDLILL